MKFLLNKTLMNTIEESQQFSQEKKIYKWGKK